MSIPNLPVNFKDDILAASNPKRKYQQTFNPDGSVSLEDVTVYTQQGSDFGASQVNQTNGAINNIYNERILDLDELELVTEPGFFVDAQAAKEAYDTLNSKFPIITSLGTYQHGVIDLHDAKIIYGAYPLHAFITDTNSGGYKADIDLSDYGFTGEMWASVTPRYPNGHPYVSIASVSASKVTLLSDVNVSGAYAQWSVIGKTN